jgi:SAM-dependent methyltransferase
MSQQLQYGNEYFKTYIMNKCLEALTYEIDRSSAYRVLEIGTRKWGPNSTHHKFLFPHAIDYVMTDFMKGEDVDIVADAEKLTEMFPTDYFDFVITCSTFEHIASPWLAANEILKVLKPGGKFFVQSHNAFPLHGYPNDMWRFTTESFAQLFKDASKIVTAYEFPCKIIPDQPVDVWLHAHQAYLNTCIFGVK